MSATATVYVVEDDDWQARVVSRVIASRGWRPLHFATAEAFIAAFDRELPACLLLDVRMPGMGGLGLLEWLQREGCVVPTIVVSAAAETHEAVRAMKSGAIDFLQKPYRRAQLVERIGQALALAEALRAAAQGRADRERRFTRLSPREREVMAGVTAGLSNKAMAVRLGISERTVEVHRAALMAKMGARTVADLIKAALRQS